MDELQKKVIMGLECCTRNLASQCSGCPYYNHLNCTSCQANTLKKDALAVLKKLVPCSPIKSPNYNYSYYGYNCPKCGHTLRVGEYRPNYCEECGQEVKWE